MAKGEEQKVTLKSSCKWDSKGRPAGWWRLQQSLLPKRKVAKWSLHHAPKNSLPVTGLLQKKPRSHNGIGRIAIGSDQSYF